MTPGLDVNPEVAKCPCPECEGTGAYNPDCWLCEGEMVIKIETALAHGYSESDLEEAYDGYCSCPSSECLGDSCELCEGDGTVDRQAIEDEITRVLICASSGSVPPRLHRLHYGRVTMEDALLANFAGVECEKRGWIKWFRSILGDDISTTPAGDEEYRSRAWSWARRRDVTLGPVDDIGRIDDDGAPHWSSGVAV